jgi:hypothetical protein
MIMGKHIPRVIVSAKEPVLVATIPSA